MEDKRPNYGAMRERQTVRAILGKTLQPVSNTQNQIATAFAAVTAPGRVVDPLHQGFRLGFSNLSQSQTRPAAAVQIGQRRVCLWCDPQPGRGLKTGPCRAGKGLASTREEALAGRGPRQKRLIAGESGVAGGKGRPMYHQGEDNGHWRLTNIGGRSATASVSNECAD